jgi:hypothetical protein
MHRRYVFDDLLRILLIPQQPKILAPIRIRKIIADVLIALSGPNGPAQVRRPMATLIANAEWTQHQPR